MPRGRPPKTRTKEEAVNIRREQVRKNVQAFRERKRLQNQESTTSQDDGDSRKNGCQSHLGIDQNLPGSTIDEFKLDNEDYLVNDDGTLVVIGSSVADSVGAPPAVQAMTSWTILPAEISCSTLSRQQFVSNCVSAFKLGIQHKIGPHWAESLPQAVNRDSALDLSIQAICMMQLGNVQCERWLLEEGALYYSRALQTVNRRLPANEVFSEEIFMAMMAMAIYELFQDSNANDYGWLIHYKAAYKYLKQLSEAKNGWVPNNRPVFHFLETLCVFDALGARRPSYFSRSESWSRSLRRWGGETYGPLLGLMTSVPALLERHDGLLKAEADVSSFAARSELLEQCFRLEDGFLEWFQHTSDRLSDFSYMYSETLAGTKKITFPTLFVARLHLLYWSTLVLILETIASVFKSMHNSSVLRGTLDRHVMLIECISKSNKYASCIRQSVGFFLDPDNGIVGKSMALLPVWIARNHFEHMGNGEEFERCDAVLGSLGQRHLKFGITVG